MNDFHKKSASTSATKLASKEVYPTDTDTSSNQKKQQASFFTISQEYAEQRIDNFLFRELKSIPKSHIYKMLRKGGIRVNRKRTKPEYKVKDGDVIRIPPRWQISGDDHNKIIAPPTPNASMTKMIQLLLQNIIYEDDALMVINKPTGMAAHGGSGINFGVIETMRRARPDLHYLELVHRLDRGTSGCMLLAKKRSTLRALHQLLREGKINKTYVLLVKGRWPWKREKQIDAALLKNQISSGERIVKVSDAGKMALTTLRPRQIFEHFENINLNTDTNTASTSLLYNLSASLLEAQIHTGKTHQIRVHTTHLGFPLAGDDKYGDKTFNKLMQKLGLRRLFLHAAELSFCLPQSSKCFHFTAPLAPELAMLLQKLR